MVPLAPLLAAVALAPALPPFTAGAKTSASSGAQVALSSVAAGCHSTYDRFVVRAGSGGTAGYDVRSVQHVIADPSGKVVPLLGVRRILVTIRNARGHTLPTVITPLCPNLRQVKKAGDFEGVVSYGLGLSRRAGFRVFRLTGPPRIVVDVAH